MSTPWGACLPVFPVAESPTISFCQCINVPSHLHLCLAERLQTVLQLHALIRSYCEEKRGLFPDVRGTAVCLLLCSARLAGTGRPGFKCLHCVQTIFSIQYISMPEVKQFYAFTFCRLCCRALSLPPLCASGWWSKESWASYHEAHGQRKCFRACRYRKGVKCGRSEPKKLL